VWSVVVVDGWSVVVVDGWSVVVCGRCGGSGDRAFVDAARPSRVARRTVETAIGAPAVPPPMAAVPPAQVDVVIRFVTDNPFLVFLVAAILGVVFFLYFLLRRSLLSARRGYEERVRER
jgi:hypothetical protein